MCHFLPFSDRKFALFGGFGGGVKNRLFFGFRGGFRLSGGFGGCFDFFWRFFGRAGDFFGNFCREEGVSPDFFGSGGGEADFFLGGPLETKTEVPSANG